MASSSITNKILVHISISALDYVIPTEMAWWTVLTTFKCFSCGYSVTDISNLPNEDHLQTPTKHLFKFITAKPTPRYQMFL